MLCSILLEFVALLEICYCVMSNHDNVGVLYIQLMNKNNTYRCSTVSPKMDFYWWPSRITGKVVVDRIQCDPGHFIFFLLLLMTKKWQERNHMQW